MDAKCYTRHVKGTFIKLLKYAAAAQSDIDAVDETAGTHIVIDEIIVSSTIANVLTFKDASDGNQIGIKLNIKPAETMVLSFWGSRAFDFGLDNHMFFNSSANTVLEVSIEYHFEAEN